MRYVSWALLLYQSFCLNIFIPWHSRGEYGLVPDGKGSSSSCCSAKAQRPACHGQSSDSKEQPGEDKKRRCAVCYLAKGYTVATVYRFDFAPAGSCWCVIENCVAQHRPSVFDFPYYPSGPPVV